MASNLTIMGNKEILLVAENIAHEKGITLQEVVEAMEEGIKLAAKKKYGSHLDIECRIDKKSGQIKLYNNIKKALRPTFFLNKHGKRLAAS